MGAGGILKAAGSLAGAATGTWWAPAAISAGSSLLGWATRRKTPKFDKTAYGKELGKVAREGKFGAGGVSRIVGQVGAKAGNVAQEQTSNIRGYLAARGMGGSIAGARTLASPETDRMRTVGEATERLEGENELSKVQGRKDYASTRYEHDMMRRDESNQARSALVGGLAQAGMSAMRGYAGKRYAEERDTGLKEIERLYQSDDPASIQKALRMLDMWEARYGYGE